MTAISLVPAFVTLFVFSASAAIPTDQRELASFLIAKNRERASHGTSGVYSIDQIDALKDNPRFRWHIELEVRGNWLRAVLTGPRNVNHPDGKRELLTTTDHTVVNDKYAATWPGGTSGLMLFEHESPEKQSKAEQQYIGPVVPRELSSLLTGEAPYVSSTEADSRFEATALHGEQEGKFLLCRLSPGGVRTAEWVLDSQHDFAALEARWHTASGQLAREWSAVYGAGAKIPSTITYQEYDTSDAVTSDFRYDVKKRLHGVKLDDARFELASLPTRDGLVIEMRNLQNEVELRRFLKGELVTEKLYAALTEPVRRFSKQEIAQGTIALPRSSRPTTNRNLWIAVAAAAGVGVIAAIYISLRARQRRSEINIGDRSPAGFTTIELMVTIAIIAILLGILFPTLHVARSVSQRTACGAKLVQIGNAVNMYANENRVWVPRNHGSAVNELMPGWQLQLGHYLSKTPLRTGRLWEYDFYRCPSNPVEFTATSYIINAMACETAPRWRPAGYTKISSMRTHSSKLAWMMESADLFNHRVDPEVDDVVWSVCHDVWRPEHFPDGPVHRISDKRHYRNTSNVLFLDGHVQVMPAGSVTEALLDDGIRRREIYPSEFFPADLQ